MTFTFPILFRNSATLYQIRHFSNELFYRLSVKNSNEKICNQRAHPPPELIDCQGLINKAPGNFLFIPLTVAGTYGFSAESKRLLFSTLNHTSNGILHHFYGKSL